jgi:predicted nucleic acid-binding protein
MKVFLDTCVLYPVLTREVLLASARAGLFTPLWSPRVLAEWTYRAAKDGPAAEVQARGEQALMAAHFPKALVTPPEALEARLWLPDTDDVHVLAAAIHGSADLILTFNMKDFPRGTLRDEGLDRQAPDEFLLGLWRATPEPVITALEALRQSVPEAPELRVILKRAGLPRLGKAINSSG